MHWKFIQWGYDSKSDDSDVYGIIQYTVNIDYAATGNRL